MGEALSSCHEISKIYETVLPQKGSKLDNVTYTVKFLYKDHLWDCPKVVLKTTFAQSQRLSLIRGALGVENEEKNNLNFANKVFNRQDVLILGGLNSEISLYTEYLSKFQNYVLIFICNYLVPMVCYFGAVNFREYKLNYLIFAMIYFLGRRYIHDFIWQELLCFFMEMTFSSVCLFLQYQPRLTC